MEQLLTQKEFDININHILEWEYLTYGVIPKDLRETTIFLIRVKELFLPIDELIFRYAIIIDEDVLDLFTNADKFRANKIEELRKNEWIRFSLVDDLPEETKEQKESKEKRRFQVRELAKLNLKIDELPENTIEEKKKKEEAKKLARRHSFRINDINADHGFHLWVVYILSPEEINHNIYDIFFAYQLRQTDLQEIYDLLNYHLEKNFVRDVGNFTRFLEILLKKYRNIISFDSHETVKKWTERKNLNKNSLGSGSTDNYLFTYQYQPESELPELYKRMNDIFIDKTTFQNFNLVFSGTPFSKIKNKLKWKCSKVLFAYFIDKLREKIPFFQDNIWQIAEHCFLNAKNLKSSKKNYEVEPKPKNYFKIDELFENR